MRPGTRDWIKQLGECALQSLGKSVQKGMQDMLPFKPPAVATKNPKAAGTGGGQVARSSPRSGGVREAPLEGGPVAAGDEGGTILDTDGIAVAQPPEKVNDQENS
jgi:hypothetical protein